MDGQIVISATDLVKDYDGVRALAGVRFSIVRGECFGFLGPNGAGKTTAMRIVCCYMPPTSGSASVLGMDVTRDCSAIKARLGVMPQDDSLDVDLGVLENLIVYSRYFDIPRTTAQERTAALLEFVELSDKASVKVPKLSGGMRRRLLLARALINRPEVLVLDEPTTGLDPHSRRAVWDKLAALKAEGTTLLLTTHYMEEAERVCDRVAIMDSGRIVTTDTPKALMEAHGGNLESVYLKLTGRSLAD
ncbi:MAG: ATP-binding cassette domain-containing protein [Deltaproteobacteria bacterium]|nr:ATP-binding cassette domain-containing protein [Deltaproteobacteria bacterium]